MSEPYIVRYLHNKGVQLGLPIMGNFELTPCCNFNCKMCYVHLSKKEAKRRGKELSTEEWIAIAQKAKEQGMLFLLLTGGEPFLRDDFIPLYTTLHKMGFVISINTNGSLLTEELLQVFKEYPPHRINVTLYGASNETYQKLCGVPFYDKVVNNIDDLVASEIQVRINASMTPYNKEDLEKIFAFGKDRDLVIKATSYMNPPVRVNPDQTGDDTNRFTAEEAAYYSVQIEKYSYKNDQFVNRIESIKNKLRMEANCGDDSLNTGMRCRAGRSSFWVTWDGRMIPCGLFECEGFSVKEEGFDRAWENTKEYVKTIHTPTECIQCEKRSVCIVCAAMCQNETGFYDRKPKYICSMMSEMMHCFDEEYLKLNKEH